MALGAKAKAERDAAFTAFVERATPTLLRTAWFLTGNDDAARDLVQATLVRTYVAWPRVRPETALAYARRILVNERTDKWRRHGAELTVPITPERPSSASSVTEDRDLIVRLLARLPELQRKVVVLRYYCDLSEQATADALNISVGSVKSAGSRGLGNLRTNLATIEGGVR